MELTRGRGLWGQCGHPRKVLSRRLSAGQDGPVSWEVRLRPQIGSFKNAVYNLMPVCFQRGVGRGRKPQKCVSRRGGLVRRLRDSPSALSFILNFLVPAAKGGARRACPRRFTSARSDSPGMCRRGRHFQGKAVIGADVSPLPDHRKSSQPA